MEVILQCKMVSRKAFEADWHDEAGEEAPPLQYQLQTLVELHLWGASHAYVCALVDNGYESELKMFRIDPHPFAFAVVCEKVKEFWRAAEAGKVPAADYAMDLGLVKFLYPPRPDGPVLDLTKDNRIAELLETRRSLASAAKRIEKEQDAVNAEIIDKLRGASTADCPDGWRVTYKMVHRKGYTVKDNASPQLRAIQRKERND
jgi:hypothetical protein